MEILELYTHGGEGGIMLPNLLSLAIPTVQIFRHIHANPTRHQNAKYTLQKHWEWTTHLDVWVMDAGLFAAGTANTWWSNIRYAGWGFPVGIVFLNLLPWVLAFNTE